MSFYTGSSAPPIEGNWEDYRWIVVTGALASFFMSWGIGANDVANAFATSVGSKTLKMWQAVVIAGIFEFAGAVGLGGETSKTVASDIANTTYYKPCPEIYMYGMLCALTIAGLWLFIATFFKLPVSTTHSIIGSIMGFALVFGGGNGVLWNAQKGDFPFSKGLLPVVLSWFFSPIIGGILGAFFFSLSKFIVLRRENSAKWAIWSLPVLLFLTFWINLMFVLSKGAKSEMAKTWPCDPKGGPGMFGLYYSDCGDLNRASCWIAALAAIGIAAIGGAIGIPLMTRRLNRERAEEVEAVEKGSNEVVLKVAEEDAEKQVMTKDGKIAMEPLYWEKPETGLMRQMAWACCFPFMFFWRQIKRGLFYDIHDSSILSANALELEAAAEQFDPQTERVYQFMQVISACAVSFAHGSNDVANAVGPFSAIFFVYENWAIPTSNSPAPKWIFVFGGVGIVIGLIMYGYNIIAELGTNLLHLTPSRGFSAELAAGMTISLSSFFGIPVSTTQIIVGCEMGVGLCEGRLDGVNWKLFAKTFTGWVFTIILNLAFCACLFSMGAYAPSIIQTQQLTQIRQQLMTMQSAKLVKLNLTNTEWNVDPVWWSGSVAAPMQYNGSKLMPVLNKTVAGMKALINPSKYVTIDQVLWYDQYAQSLFMNYSVQGVGQNNVPAVEAGIAAYKPDPVPAGGK